ncbi:MAG: peptidyl-prolyl cis-trans isomerase [Candidatus Sumerlaeota bacterium]|nr:peptidyl-prolyl cis-trans isomerase [Candidatus Sumerlaeota bacterium]
MRPFRREPLRNPCEGTSLSFGGCRRGEEFSAAMMQTLRNPKVLKMGLWVILVLTIPSFVLFYGFGGSDSPSGGSMGPKTAYVTVQADSGKVEIGAQELKAAREELTNEYLRLYMGVTGQQPTQRVVLQIQNGLTNKQIAEYAVSRVAFSELAEKSDLLVTNEQVSRMLREQGVTAEQLNAFLKSQGMREIDYLRQERFRLRTQRMESLIGSLAKTSLLELWLQYKLENDRLRVAYAKVPVSNYLDEVEVTDTEVQEYYEANLDRFVKPEERVYRYVLQEAPPLPDKEYEVTEERVQELYDAIDPQQDPRFFEEPGRTVRHIMVKPAEGESADEAMARAEELRRRIVEDGENFAVLANQESQDEEARAGGLVKGRVREETKDEFVALYGPAWYDAATYYNVDDISNVLESEGNYYILKIDAESDGKLPLDRARPILEGMIRSELRAADEIEQREQMQALQIKMQQEAASRTSIDGIARALGSEVRETSPTLATRYSLPGIGDLSSHRETIDDLEEGDIGPVMMATGTNNLVILQLAEIIPERNFSLGEVHDDAAEAVRRQKATERAREVADDLAERVRSGDSITSAALELNLAARETEEPFGRMERPADLRMVQEFPNVTLRGDVGDVFVAQSGFGDFVDSWVAFEILSKQEPEKSAFLKDMQQLELGMTNAKQMMFVDEFRKDSLETMKAEFDEDYIKQDQGRRSRRSGG